MKILVTGGTGFLGRHVVSKLEQGSHEIIAPNSHQLNLLSRDQTDDYIRKNSPEVILHMAAICGGILANKNSPADFLQKNTEMAVNIFEVSKIYKCTKIYTLGSVCAYPKFCPVPFKEDDIWNGYPEETNAPYGMSKRLLLMMSQCYRAQYGFAGAHLIPVNLYGEYDHFDLVNSHVIPALIRKFDDASSHNKPYVECWGTGTATREFLYAGDAAEAISKAVTSGLDYQLPINLGTGQDISIKDLAQLMGKLFNYTGDIIFTGEVSDGQPKRLLDVSRAAQILGWRAKTSLEEGLQKTIKWYKSSKR
jgi:GDP-L-fucose synthase